MPIFFFYFSKDSEPDRCHLLIYTESHQEKMMESKLCSCVLKLALTPSLDPSVPPLVFQDQPAVFSVTVILQIAGQCV